MSPPRARVIRVREGGEAATARPLWPASERSPSMLSPPTHRRIAREEVEARLTAERIEGEARERADAILAEARQRAVTEGAQARAAAMEQAQAEAIAQWVAVRSAEGARLDRDADRVIAVAVALAERLLGTSLELGPERVVSLAQGVLAEARGARRAVIEAHPIDAAALRSSLSTVAAGGGAASLSLEVADDPTLARGALRLHTDLGILDAQLAPRLERLAAALADVLAAAL